jgi:hypothetical protein
MRPKDKGTRRETWVVRLLQEHGLQASRAPNNMPSLDVEAKAGPFPLYIEVKDRAALSLHPVLEQVQRRYPKAVPHVVWHRTKKTEKKRVPVGPTLIALPIEEYAKLMSYLDFLWREKYEDRSGDAAIQP